MFSLRNFRVKFPDKLGKELDADYHQKIVMKFSLKEMSSGELTAAHQVITIYSNIAINFSIARTRQRNCRMIFRHSKVH